jgi:hypothetical protein
MAMNFYHHTLPDYRDLDNQTGQCPGFFFGVRENEGGIGLYMYPANTSGDDEREYAVFLNIDEARYLLDALQRAIDRAAPKNKPRTIHRARVW